MNPAIFLDRDGVLIENRDDYVRCWEDVVFIPGVLEVLHAKREAPYRFVLVTNQSAIGRGLLSLPDAHEINRRVLSTVTEHGGRIDGLYMCPHAPEAGCNCRKPQPGLLLQAANELSIDLSRSIMIGDALSDLEAGRKAGVRELALLRTGRGNSQEKRSDAVTLAPFAVFDDLAQALEHFIPSFHS